jgi:hypothetical protein
VPRKVSHAREAAIRLHEVDGHPLQALIKASLEGLDVPALYCIGLQGVVWQHSSSVGGWIGAVSVDRMAAL